MSNASLEKNVTGYYQYKHILTFWTLKQLIINIIKYAADPDQAFYKHADPDPTFEDMQNRIIRTPKLIRIRINLILIKSTLNKK